MTDQEAAVAARLRELGIAYARHEHPPVATVEEAEAHWAGIDAHPLQESVSAEPEGEPPLPGRADGVEAG